MAGLYKTRMASWVQSVASRDEMTNAANDSQGGNLPFSPAMFPIVSHPLVREEAPGTAYWLLAQRLYAYLHWTVRLETDSILPVAKALVEDAYDLRAGRELERDALKIMHDEATHAWEALTTKHDVIELTHVLPERQPEPHYVGRLAAVRDQAAPEDRRLVDLLFAIVSETLITKMLTQLPRDEMVLPQVRTSVHAHARDEARHHLVFSAVLRIAWHRWSAPERERFAPWLAEFIAAFLRPDLGAARSWLVGAGLSRASAAAVVEDIYPERAVQLELREGAAPSLRSMRQAGLFECRAFVDSLGARGLL